jgi:transposase
MSAKACKGNFAAYVKVILPYPFSEGGDKTHNNRIYNLDSCGIKPHRVQKLVLTVSLWRHNYIYITGGGAMARSRSSRKTEALRQHGSLNPHPEAVRHEMFQSSEFFDPADLVQVKYEMLRQVLVESSSVTEAAAAFGLSRPSFYEAQAAFAESGLLGLVPEKRGPRRAHKLSADVVEFLRVAKAEDPTLSGAALRDRLWREQRLRVHRRSIERALARGQKKRPAPMPERS